MKQQLFGLRKAHIDKLLKQIKMGFTSSKNELKIELEKLKAENRQLEKELSERTNAVQALEDDMEIWAYGQERIQTVLQILENEKNIEIEKLQKQFQDEVSEINRQIEVVDLEIRSVKNVFSDIIDQFTGKVNQSDDFSAQPEAAASIELNDEIEVPLMTMIAQEEELLMATTVNKEEDLLIGTTVNKEEELQMAPTVDKEEELQSTIIAKEEDDQRPKDSESSQTNDEPFWGDLEKFHHDDFSFLKESSTNSNGFFQFDQEFTEKVIEQEEARPPAPSEMKREEATKRPEPHSDALLAQIDTIKTQYIVGKVAGEDLLDLQGKIIVAKDSLITRDAVEKANRVGKLAELIVNMKLSGGLG